MISEARSLIVATIQRVKTAKISIGLWAAFAISAMSPAIFTVYPAAVWSDTGWFLELSAVVLMATAMMALILVTSWKLTRACADQQHYAGAFWSWLGWSLVAYLPALIALVALAMADPDGRYPFVEILIWTVIAVLLAPLLVHASGRAVDANGPAIGVVWKHWSKRYLSLLFAMLVLTGPIIVLSEIAYLVDDYSFIWSVIGGWVSLPAMLLGIAMTVEAFHRVPHNRAT
jgi:hypothetical protein